MPSNVHKKLVFGALGCGGLFAVLAGIGLLFQHSGLLPNDEASKSVTPAQSAAAWDSLSAASVATLLAEHPDPYFFPGPRAQGFLIIMDSQGRGPFLLLGDTFPPGSDERRTWDGVAQRVIIQRGRPKNAVDLGPSLMAPVMLFRTRILLAAADRWSRRGSLPEAGLAFDSALTAGIAYAHSDDLDRVWVGARIERDAMDLLSRDTALAGGATAAGNARLAVARLDRLVRDVHALDRWILATGADPRFVDSLAVWVSDSSLPVAARIAAAHAIAMGWVFGALEPGIGPVSARRETLNRLRESSLPDAVAAAIDRDLQLGSGLTERFRAIATYRAERMLLLQP